MSSVDLDRQNRVIVECLRASIDDLIAVYRFGSTVHGRPTAKSDTDIAILAGQPIPLAAWFDLQDNLAVTLGSEVDLLDLTSASPVLTIQVIVRGLLLYEGDESRRGHFEGDALGAYARLNEERRGILERIRAEGTIYGR